MEKMVKMAAVSLLLMNFSACSIGGSAGDHVTLTGTPAGMMAFSDFVSGSIRTGKESPDRPSEYFEHRKTQEVHKTQRHAQGFWQKLVN